MFCFFLSWETNNAWGIKWSWSTHRAITAAIAAADAAVAVCRIFNHVFAFFSGLLFYLYFSLLAGSLWFCSPQGKSQLSFTLTPTRYVVLKVSQLTLWYRVIGRRVCWNSDTVDVGGLCSPAATSAVQRLDASPARFLMNPPALSSFEFIGHEEGPYWRLCHFVSAASTASHVVFLICSLNWVEGWGRSWRAFTTKVAPDICRAFAKALVCYWKRSMLP